MNYSLKKLGALTEVITKGTTPSNIGEDFSETGIMYFRSELIGKSKYIDKSTGLLYISESTHRKLKRSQIHSGDMLFSMAGAYLGKISLARDEDIPANTNQAVAIIRFIPGSCNIEYVYYYMMQSWYNNYISSFNSQAAQPNINLSQIGKLIVNIPNRLIQNRIVSVLSAYDSLIENNNKRIKVLEHMAENLYKEWFVRFRFPGHENAEFENGIPKGWTYCRLKELFEIKYGKDHKSIAEGEIPIFGSGGIMRYGDKAIYSNESVLIPRKGTLNNIMYVNEPFWTVDTMFYTILLKPNFAKYAYYTLANVDMESYNSGAALPSMTTDILYHLRILVPDNRTLKLFDEFISDINIQKKRIEVINNNLTKQRDLLLPRLMSGKLEV